LKYIDCKFKAVRKSTVSYTVKFTQRLLIHSVWVYDIWYDIFIYRNWVSTRWQWSVSLHKKRKEKATFKRRNKTQNNTRTQNTQN